MNELDSTGDQLEFRQAIPTRAPYVKRLVTGGVMVTAVIVDFHRTQEGRRTPHNCFECRVESPKSQKILLLLIVRRRKLLSSP